MIIVLMGVSGAGKTTVGKLLSIGLGWNFYEGDDFHPASNIEKMKRGTPLDDSDRRPWLDSIRRLLHELERAGEQAVVACSALKESYRQYLSLGCADIRFVYLKGDFGLIGRRIAGRRGHFMKSLLLESQFDSLEEPRNVLVVDVSLRPGMIVSVIREAFGL